MGKTKGNKRYQIIVFGLGLIFSTQAGLAQSTSKSVPLPSVQLKAESPKFDAVPMLKGSVGQSIFASKEKDYWALQESWRKSFNDGYKARVAGDNRKAWQGFYAAVQFAQQMADDDSLVMSLASLAGVYAANKQYKEAQQLIARAEALRKSTFTAKAEKDGVGPFTHDFARRTAQFDEKGAMPWSSESSFLTAQAQENDVRLESNGAGLLLMVVGHSFRLKHHCFCGH